MSKLESRIEALEAEREPDGEYVLDPRFYDEELMAEDLRRWMNQPHEVYVSAFPPIPTSKKGRAAYDEMVRAGLDKWLAERGRE